MALINQSQSTPHKLAEKIGRQRDLFHHRSRRVEELRERIADYEIRYGITSDRVHEAIDRHELSETAEVCDWIIDYELLLRAQSAGE